MDHPSFVPSRRTLLKASAAAAGVALSMPPTISQAADTLVVNSQGGEYQELFERTVIRPFEKKFGVQVVHDPVGLSSQDYARIRASRGAPGFDVAAVLTAVELNLGAREGYLEKISEREVPNLKHVWEQSRSLPSVGVCHSVQYATLIHLKKHLEAPTSWMDYWHPEAKYGEKIKGRVLTFNPASLLATFTLIAGAEASGGSALNMEPAWANLAHLKPYVGSVQTAIAAAIAVLQQERVWLMPCWSARANYYLNSGMDIGVTVPKEGTMAFHECAAVPTGATNKKLAFEFLNFMLEPEIQSAYCQAYQISPGRGDITSWPAAFVAQQITTPEKMANLRFADLALVADKTREWTLRWQEVMGA